MGVATAPTLYLPDYLHDTTSRRAVKMTRRIGGGAGLIPRLLIATRHAPLSWVIVPLGRGSLYAHATNAHVRALTGELVGSTPAWCALQRGVEGGLHVNILLPAAAVSSRRSLPKGTYVKDGIDLVGVMRYLSGPPDARSNRSNKEPRTGIHRRTSPEQLAAAREEYGAACRPGRLPRMQCLARHRPRR